MARSQSRNEQTKVRENRGEEANYSDQRTLRGIPRYVEGLYCNRTATYSSLTEEFGIYLSYVRKLGFEENPDYDFLRELFSKVLKNIGEVDDGVFDWMLLNGGKGWEASAVGGVRVFRR